MFLRKRRVYKRKVIIVSSPVEAKVAHPQLGPEVHLTDRVENCLAVLSCAHDWVILDGRQVWPLLLTNQKYVSEYIGY